MAKKKHLSRYASASMKGEYLKQSDESIRSLNFVLKEAKKRLKEAIKGVKWCEEKLKAEQEKRKEILNLK